MVKSEDIKDWAGLWMRVDGNKGKILAFDNMQDRPIEGTLDWHRVEVTLDIDENAQNLAFGILLVGKGTAWIDDLNFEVVDSSVPVTGEVKKPRGKGPSNLSFEE
jgi:hypothetical protein